MKIKCVILIILTFSFQSCYFNTLRLKKAVSIGVDKDAIKNKNYTFVRNYGLASNIIYSIISVDGKPVEFKSNNQTVILSPGYHTFKVKRNYDYRTYENKSYGVYTRLEITTYHVGDVVKVSYNLKSRTGYVFGGQDGPSLILCKGKFFQSSNIGLASLAFLLSGGCIAGFIAILSE